jgi:hypothetical protein
MRACILPTTISTPRSPRPTSLKRVFNRNFSTATPQQALFSLMFPLFQLQHSHCVAVGSGAGRAENIALRSTGRTGSEGRPLRSIPHGFLSRSACASAWSWPLFYPVLNGAHQGRLTLSRESRRIQIARQGCYRFYLPLACSIPTGKF